MGNALAAAEALNALDVLHDAAMAAALKSNFDARNFCLAAACTSDCWNPPLELPVMPAVKGREDDKVCVMGVGRSDNRAAAAAAAAKELMLQRHCSKHAACPRPLMHAPADRICLRPPCGTHESLQHELLTSQMFLALLTQLG